MGQYADLLEQAQSKPAIDAATSPAVALSIAADAIPAQEAEYQRLAKKYNVPVDIPRAMPEEYKARAKLDDSLAASHGIGPLQNWLADPDKARIAQNDVGVLGGMGRLFQAFKGGFSTADLQAENTDLSMDELNNRPMSDAQIRRQAQIKQELGDLSQQKQSETAGEYTARTTGYSARQGASNLLTSAQGAGYGGVAGAALGLPTGIGAAPGAVAGMAVGGALGAGLYSYRMEAASAWDELKDRKDVNGVPLNKDIARAAAHATGVINGAIEIGSDVALGWLVSKIPGVREMIGNATGLIAKKAAIREFALANPTKMATVWGALKTALGISATEGSEEFVQQLAGGAVQRIAESVSGQTFTPKPWSEDIVEGTQAAGEAFTGTMLTLGLLAGGGHYISARVQARQEAKIAQAQQDSVKLQELFKRANQSEVRTLDAGTFAEVAQQMADGTEGAPKSVFIDARKLSEILAENPEAQGVFNQMSQPVQEELRSAMEQGGLNLSVEMPIGELLSVATGTPLESALMPHLRTQEDGLSQTEAKEADAETQKMLEQNIDRMVSESKQGEELRQMGMSIREDYKARIVATGLHTAEQADVLAAAPQAFYTALASKSGMTPKEAMKQYEIQVKGGETVQTETVKQAAEQDKRQMIEARKREAVLKQLQECMQ